MVGRRRVTSVRRRLPWPLKLAAKVAIGQLRVPYSVWQRVGVFEHGEMRSAAYASGVVKHHLALAGHADLCGKVVLEIGPGDSALSGLVAAGLGASDVVLVDTGAFADTEVELYRRGAAELRAQGLDVPSVDDAATFDEVLEACRARYLTGGVTDLTSLGASVVDVSWSNAVLEHVRRTEFDDLLRALWRVHVPGGISTHTVDLQDHLEESLNNLRLPERLWESALVARAGVYTNRIGYTETIERCVAAGWSVDVPRVDRWSRLPVPRRQLRAPWRDRAEEDLLVRGFDLVLTKPPV